MRWRAPVRRAALLLGGVTLPLGWLLAAPASGAPSAATPATAPPAAAPPAAATPASAPRTVTVGDLAEAWYASSPVDACTTPLGCPPQEAPSSPYPANTLHVGVAGGQETARTYVLPDLTLMPFGATPLHATMTLPLATGNGDGTQSPATATLRACLAKQVFPDGTQGSTQTPPGTDCSVAAKASYDAKHSLFTLDLSGFLTAWAAGKPQFGLALLPGEGAAPTDAWHLAFNGRKRATGKHITSTVTFTAPPPSDFGGTSISGSALGPANPPPAAPPPATSPGSMPAPSTGTPPEAPPVVAGAQAAPAPVAQPVAFTKGFQYPLAFLFPLLLLAGGVFFARLFTRDATPRPVPS